MLAAQLKCKREASNCKQKSCIPNCVVPEEETQKMVQRCHVLQKEKACSKPQMNPVEREMEI